MSWDGIYSKDRNYPEFEIGTEVKTNRKYKSITPGKGYIVLNCYNPSTWNKDDNRRVITIVTDRGYQVDYSSHYFEKTDNQLKTERRENLLNNLGL
jgi:hypothetical protein